MFWDYFLMSFDVKIKGLIYQIYQKLLLKKQPMLASLAFEILDLVCLFFNYFEV